MITKILVALDGSENSFKALSEAITMAINYGAELHTITVEEIPKYPATISEVKEQEEFADKKFKEIADQVKKIAAKEGVNITPHMKIGNPEKVILDMLGNACFDALVIGFMGRSAIYERIMGSSYQKLIRLAPCSVFVIKTGPAKISYLRSYRRTNKNLKPSRNNLPKS